MIMIKQKWGVVLLVFLTIIYLGVFYFSKSAAETTVTEIYFADRITAAHKKLIEQYNTMMEGRVRVVPIDFPNFDFSTNERKEVLARSLRGMGDGIDLFAVDVIWVPRFARWCEPLDKYFTEEEKSRILPQAMQSCYSNGELVAVPLNLVQGIMYYRRDLIEKLLDAREIIRKLNNKITWEDFIKLHEKLKLQNPFYIYPAADYEGFICSFMEILLEINPNYFHQYGFNLEKPEAERALQLLVDLIFKYKMTPPVVNRFTEIHSYEYFIKNDGLFLRGWPSYDKDFEENPYDTSKENRLAKAYLPHFNGKKPASLLGGWNLMVSKFSNKKDWAIDFAKFLLQDKSQETFYVESRHFPVVSKIYTDSGFIKKYPQFREIGSLLKTGVHRPFHTDYTRYSKIMSYYFEQAVSGRIPVKEALIKATNDIQSDKNITND